MKPLYKNFKLLIAIPFILFAFFATTTELKAQTSIAAIGTTYSQNFNTLTPAGAWADNSTITSWYALDANGSTSTSFVLNDGEISTDGLTSFGTVASSDRALGFAPVGNVGEKMYVGWRFKNNTGITINSLVINWTGEQWRDEDVNAQSITLNYQISASAITAINTGILETTGLEFQSPQISGSNLKLNGNLSGNRVSNSHTINDPIAPGSEIIIVWETTDMGINHLMAIDDISVTAKASQVITFNSPTTKTFGDASFNPGATATSGLSVTYTSSNLNVATVSGSTITIVGPGRSTITAIQAGNASFTPATDVPRTLNVKPKAPNVIEATNITTTSFQANWTADNGLNDGTTTYTLEYATVKSFSPKTTRNSSSKFYNVTTLTPNTIYFYKVYAINTSNNSAYTESSAITTGTNYVTANTGNWDTGANWDVGYINNVANSITIQHSITLNTVRDSVTTNTLIVKPTGKLTTNQKIHVTNQLIIEVDANGNAGQILNTGNIHIGYNAKIIVRKTFSAPVKWHFMGFPFDVAAANIYSGGTSTPLTWGDLNSGANFVVQQYNGDTRASAGTAEVVNQGLHWGNVASKVFTAKRGYIVYKTTPGTIDFTARGTSIGNFFSVNGATVSAGRYTASLPIHSYWNLICSPLSSKYNLGSTSPSTSYYTYNGTNYFPALANELLDIQPFSAFFLQAPATSISFANAGRKVSSLSSETASVVDDIYLNLSNGNNLYDDQTRIRLQAGASADYVIGTDAAKMFGMDSNVSYIYSTINGFYTAINTLPATTSNVELQTKFATNGTYTVSISNTDKILNYAAVILYDKVTGVNTDLLSVGSYTFSSSAGTTNRFTVKLSPKITTGVSISETSDISISSVANNAKISGLNATANVTIYNMSGKVAYRGLVENNQTIRLENKGLYIFEITIADRKENIKVYIK